MPFTHLKAFTKYILLIPFFQHLFIHIREIQPVIFSKSVAHYQCNYTIPNLRCKGSNKIRKITTFKSDLPFTPQFKQKNSNIKQTISLLLLSMLLLSMFLLSSCKTENKSQTIFNVSSFNLRFDNPNDGAANTEQILFRLAARLIHE